MLYRYTVLVDDCYVSWCGVLCQCKIVHACDMLALVKKSLKSLQILFKSVLVCVFCWTRSISQEAPSLFLGSKQEFLLFKPFSLIWIQRETAVVLDNIGIRSVVQRLVSEFWCPKVTSTHWEVLLGGSLGIIIFIKLKYIKYINNISRQG